MFTFGKFEIGKVESLYLHDFVLNGHFRAWSPEDKVGPRWPMGFNMNPLEKTPISYRKSGKARNKQHVVLLFVIVGLFL